MQHENPLKILTFLHFLSYSVFIEADIVFTDCVSSSGIVICCILLAFDELIGVEKLFKPALLYLLDGCGVEVDTDCSRNVFL